MKECRGTHLDNGAASATGISKPDQRIIQSSKRCMETMGMGGKTAKLSSQACSDQLRKHKRRHGTNTSIGAYVENAIDGNIATGIENYFSFTLACNSW